jgi:hypothetical protein
MGGESAFPLPLALCRALGLAVAGIAGVAGAGVAGAIVTPGVVGPGVSLPAALAFLLWPGPLLVEGRDPLTDDRFVPSSSLEVSRRGNSADLPSFASRGA